QHHRRSNYSDGVGVLAWGAAHSRSARTGARRRCARRSATLALRYLGDRYSGADRAFHAAYLDHAPAALATLVSGIVHQRRAQPARAAALAFPCISVGGLRVCRARVWFFGIFSVGAHT